MPQCQMAKRKEIGPEATAVKAVEYWNAAYDGWLPRIDTGKWGGGDAIIMPDLEKMSVQLDTEKLWHMLQQTMKKRFHDKGFWHGDAAWRNVALVRNANHDISKVCMIDLEPQGMIEQAETSKWGDFKTMWTDFKYALRNDWEQFKAAEQPVYRAMSRNGNLCVLKYFVKGQYAAMPNGNRKEIGPEATAVKAVEYWNAAYDGWLPRIDTGKWGGGDAIIMPDLEKMSVQLDTEKLWHMLQQTMKKRFHDKGFWHGDAAWRNVALVRNANHDISKVCMIDLEPQGMIEQAETSKWGDFETMWTDFKCALLNDWEQFKAAEQPEAL